MDVCPPHVKTVSTSLMPRLVNKIFNAYFNKQFSGSAQNAEFKSIYVKIFDHFDKRYTNGRDIDGEYKYVEDDGDGKNHDPHSGRPIYIKGQNKIWFCTWEQCNFEGWVLGQKEQVTTSKRQFFSDYNNNNHYRIFLRFRTQGRSDCDPTSNDCCPNPFCPCYLGGGDVRSRYTGK